MRFSLIALFLLSLIVAVISGYRSRSRVRAQRFGRSYYSPKFDSRNVQPASYQHIAFNHNAGYSSGGTHSYPASTGSSGNSYSGNVQNLNPKSGLGVNPFARLPRYRDTITAKPHYTAKSGSGDIHSYPASSGSSGNSNSGNVQNLNPKSGLGVNPFARLPRYRDTITAKPHYSAKSGSSGVHSYPASTGNSGNRNSDNARQTYHQQHNVVHTSYRPKTEVHHHYHYNPPHQIRYGSTFHPVYQGHPPIYVYKYRNSGSRFDNLLTGLALYNLGRNSHSHHYSSDRQYISSPGEICKLRINKGLDDYEETRIDCNLMSSFIWDDTTTTSWDDQQTSSTVEDGLNVKGPSIQVMPGMTCSMIRTFRDTTTMRRSVDCELLQEYAHTMFDEGIPITQSTSNPEVDPFRHLTFPGAFFNSSSANVHHNVDLNNHVLKNDSKHHFVNLSNLFSQEYARSSINRSEEGLQIPQSTFVYPTGRFVTPSNTKEHRNVDQRHLILKNSSNHHKVHLHDFVLKNNSKNLNKKYTDKSYVFMKNGSEYQYMNQHHHVMKNVSGGDPFRRLFELSRYSSSAKQHHNMDQHHRVMKNSFYPGNIHQTENPKSYMSIDDALLELRRIAGWFNSSSSQLHHDAKSGSSSSNVLPSQNGNRGSADDAIRRLADDAIRRSAYDDIRRSADDGIHRSPDEAIRRSPDDAIRRSADDAIRRSPDDAIRRSADDAIRRSADDAIRRSADDAISRSAGLPQKLDQDSTKRGSDSGNVNAKIGKVGDAVRRLSDRYSFFKLFDTES